MCLTHLEKKGRPAARVYGRGERREEKTKLVAKVCAQEAHILKLRRHEIHALLHGSRERTD